MAARSNKRAIIICCAVVLSPFLFLCGCPVAAYLVDKDFRQRVNDFRYFDSVKPIGGGYGYSMIKGAPRTITAPPGFSLVPTDAYSRKLEVSRYAVVNDVILGELRPYGFSAEPRCWFLVPMRTGVPVEFGTHQEWSDALSVYSVDPVKVKFTW